MSIINCKVSNMMAKDVTARRVSARKNIVSVLTQVWHVGKPANVRIARMELAKIIEPQALKLVHQSF